MEQPPHSQLLLDDWELEIFGLAVEDPKDICDMKFQTTPLNDLSLNGLEQLYGHLIRMLM